jgi:hypothetical protein
MDYPVLVILGVLGIGALFVVLPVALTTLSEHREPRSVVCPETGGRASVQVDARGAVRGAIFGRSFLRAEGCSLWPEKSGCAQKCLAPAPEPSSAPSGV